MLLNTYKIRASVGVIRLYKIIVKSNGMFSGTEQALNAVWAIVIVIPMVPYIMAY
jgi:hypothetical protein